MSSSDFVSDSEDEVKVENDGDDLPPNVTDRKRKDKQAARAKRRMDELKAQVAALTAQLEQAKQAARVSQQQLQAAGGGGAGAAAQVVNRVPDFRELKEYVSTFDPKIPTCPSSDVWVQSIDNTGEVYGWTHPTRLHCARLNLGGCAKLWLEGCQEAVRDWATFKAEIIKGFPSKKNPVYYHNLLSSRKWKAGETVEEYAYEMLAMGKKGGFTEEVTVTYITSGLKQYVRRAGMTIGKVTTVEELLNEMRWIDSVDAVAVTKCAEPVATTSGGGQRKSESSTDECFLCHQPGHRARNCPSVKCHVCKKEGHMKKDCPSAKREEKALPMKTIRVIEKKSAFVKDVIIDGVPMKALVDTGGRVSTIQDKYAKQVGKVKPTQKVLRGFGKKDVIVTSKVCTKLQVDDVILPVELQVVPTWVQDTAVILGEDVIDRDRLVMETRKGDVKFQWESGSQQTRKNDSDQAGSGVVAGMFTIEVQSTSKLIAEKQLSDEGTEDNNTHQMVEQNRDCVALSTKEEGCAKSTEVTSADPVYVEPRKLEYMREKVLSEQIDELLEAGIITKAESPYNSQVVVLVPKENEQIRMDDYSDNNKIPLKEDSQNNTACSMSEGLYRFRRMPFGVVKECAVFQRDMKEMMEVMKKQNGAVVPYIDDLFLPGSSEAEQQVEFRDREVSSAVDRGGSKMQQEDALSRSPTEDPKEIATVADCVMMLELSNADFMQMRITKLMEVVQKQSWDPFCDEGRQMLQYVVDNQRLCRKVGKKCWLVPNNVRWRIVRSYYDERDHFGEQKVLQRVHLGPFPKSSKGNEHILAVVSIRTMMGGDWNWDEKDVVQNEVISVWTAENENPEVPMEERRERVQRVKQKRYFDDNRREGVRYQVDDLVLVVKDQHVPGSSRKLEPRCEVPFVVTEVRPNDGYHIQTGPGFDNLGRRYTTVYSADRMKRWYNVAELDDAVDCSSDEEELN